MSFTGLNFPTWTMKFTAGLQQKSNDYALDPPALDIALDIQFDEDGGIQTRFPFADLGVDVFGGGTLENIRRVVVNGAELLCFTKDALYSWNAQLSQWVSRATYLAAAVDEQTIFATTGDQMDGDRAELAGTVVFTWMERVGSSSKGYVAAIDKTSGSVLMAPTALAGSASRLRVTALSTKILLSFYDGVNGLYAYALDPADPAAALAGASTTLTNANFGEYYDIVRWPTADAALFATRQSPTTSYTVGTVSAGLVVSTVTKARTCDGAIAISCAPAGTHVQIARANTTNVQGDLLRIDGGAFTDVYTAQAIGTVPASTSPRNIAAAHRSAQDGGQYRCYVTWSYSDGIGGFQESGSKSNWVDTGNTLGTQADFVDRLGMASRSFDHDGRVFTWLVFAEVSEATTNGGADPVTTYGALQNTYFLYRDDGLLCGKAAVNVAGASYLASVGFLPGVQNVDTNKYAWCGIESRVVVVGLASSYGDRGPREITVEFDSNKARRCARLGRTLYITGAEVMQYDGVRLVELGFHVYPWQLDLTAFPSVGMTAGTFGYKMGWRYDNARGERERSTTATEGTVDRAADTMIRMQPQCQLNVTHKSTPAVAAEVWRTKTNPPDGAPYFLVTSPDPTVTSGDNYYYANDVTAMSFGGNNDTLTDDEIAVKEEHPENGAVLENLAPPPATIIAASDTRLFLAGVAGDPNRIWYSKQRGPDELAAFHDALRVDVPLAGGDITALAFLNETLIAFRETAIYAVPGDGFDNASGGFNYGPARTVSVDVGAVSAESVAVTDRGVVFKSSKGWYLLDRGFSLTYIGEGVADYDDEDPVSVSVAESQHQVRVLTSQRMLVLDTRGGQWFEWSIAGGASACTWGGSHVYATSGAVKKQRTDYTGVDYGMDVELAWLKPADLNGYVCVNEIQIHGEYRSEHRLRLRLARDHWKDGVDTYFQDKTWTVSPTTVGAREKVALRPKIRQLESLKLRITALGRAQEDLVPNGEALKLTGLSVELGIQRGTNRALPAAQKQ